MEVKDCELKEFVAKWCCKAIYGDYAEEANIGLKVIHISESQRCQVVK